MVKVHYFDSTGEAYDATQCRDDIERGDILVIKSENVVGIADTWPFAITEQHGALHRFSDAAETIDTYQDGRFSGSKEAAEREIRRLARLNAPKRKAYNVVIRRLANGADYSMRLFCVDELAAQAAAKDRVRLSIGMRKMDYYHLEVTQGIAVFRVISCELSPDQSRPVA